jgi:hypothetical protein
MIAYKGIEQALRQAAMIKVYLNFNANFESQIVGRYRLRRRHGVRSREGTLNFLGAVL